MMTVLVWWLRCWWCEAGKGDETGEGAGDAKSKGGEGGALAGGGLGGWAAQQGCASGGDGERWWGVALVV